MKYSFEMALAFMKQGKSICRECDLGLYRILDGVVVHEDEHGFCGEALFMSDEVLAEDWEVMDEDRSEWKELDEKWKEMEKKWREME